MYSNVSNVLTAVTRKTRLKWLEGISLKNWTPLYQHYNIIFSRTHLKVRKGYIVKTNKLKRCTFVNLVLTTKSIQNQQKFLGILSIRNTIHPICKFFWFWIFLSGICEAALNELTCKKIVKAISDHVLLT